MTSSASHILSIDNGTQSIRALVFDLEGNLIAKSKIEIEPYFSEHPGWAEQDPEYYWRVLGEACQQLWDNPNVKKENIKGVALTTQRGTVINLDADGKPLRPAIVWLDQRQADVSKPLGRGWDWLFKLIGAEEMIKIFRAKTQATWIEQNQPDIWDKTDKFLLLSGYLTYRLTGKFVDSTGCTVGYFPFDYKKKKWAPDFDWKWRVAPVKKSMLTDLVQPTDSLGVITKEAADHTGIPEGLPLVAAASDKACEVIGSGGVDSSIGCLSFGTTATINTTSYKYVEPIPLMPPYPSAIPEAYCTEVMIYRGFWMVSWFKKEFAANEQRIADEKGVEPEILFDELVNTVPPGSMGLMLQPYWSPGLRVPGPEAKGAMIGFGDVHNRSYMYRAILEGLVYALREGKERIEKRTKVPITTIRVSGGGSQSDAAMQITADVFGVSVERPHTYETSGLGAAIDAAVGLGLHPDFKTAIKKMTHVGKVFTPNMGHHKTYDRLYNEVYLKMYKRLQPLYQSIRDITGYPEKY